VWKTFGVDAPNRKAEFTAVYNALARLTEMGLIQEPKGGLLEHVLTPLGEVASQALA
jgi:hypothetical protein